MMYERGFIGAADGNLAVRLDEKRLSSRRRAA
jgi:hypothetical protein